MLNILNLSARREVEVSMDPALGTAEATKFEIGVLDSRLVSYIRDKSMDVKVNPEDPEGEPETNLRMNEMFYLAAQFGLRGFENLRDHDGNDIEFRTVKRSVGGKSYSIISNRILDALPMDAIMEIGQAVLADADVDEETAGNSEG